MNGDPHRLRSTCMKSALLGFLILLGGPLPVPELLESLDQDLVVTSVRSARRNPEVPPSKERLHRQTTPTLTLPRPTDRVIAVPSPPDDLRSAIRLGSRPPPTV
jgi:hypothetical protein